MGNACGRSTTAVSDVKPLPGQRTPSDSFVPIAHRAVTASWLRGFCAKTGADELSTSNVVARIIKPGTETARLSYAQMSARTSESGSFGKLDYFISHAWTNSFGKLVEIVSDMAAKEAEQGKPEPYFWIDCIAINQHKVDGELEELGNVLRDAKATVAICDPWDKPVAVSRSWCLYEFLTTIQSKRNLIVALSRDQQSSFIAALVEHFDSVDRWISRVDARQAAASMPEDKAKIDGAVTSTIGFELLNETVQVALKRWLRDAGEEVLEQLIKELGPQHDRVLRLQNSLGMMLRMQQADRAAMLRAAHHCAAVLQARRALLGAAHPDTLASLGCLGMIHRALGDGATALEELREAHSGLVSALGKQHPAALRAANDLAFTLKAQGELARAEELLAEALRLLGAELRELREGNPGAAADAAGEVSLGPGASADSASRVGVGRRLDELEDLRCSLLSNRGGVLALQGRHIDALEQLEAAWAVKQRLKGAKHPSSLMTGADVAVVRHRKAVSGRPADAAAAGAAGGEGRSPAESDAAAALALQREMLAACTEVLGREHRHTAMLSNNLAVMLVEQRWWAQRAQQPQRTAGAGTGAGSSGSGGGGGIGSGGGELTSEELFERALRAYVRSRGPGHPCTLAVQLNRGLAEAVDQQAGAESAPGGSNPTAAGGTAASPGDRGSGGSSRAGDGEAGAGSGAGAAAGSMPAGLRRLAEHVQQHEEARDALQAALPEVLRVLLGEPEVPCLRMTSGGGDEPQDPVRTLQTWLLVNMAANLELLQAPKV